MTQPAATPAAWLAAAQVSDEVFALRPDYCVVLLTADGLCGGPSNEVSDAILSRAQQQASALLEQRLAEALPHAAQWREAYRSFGAKPQRTRPSVEALLRRVADGLPRIDRITDVYNAVSISHVLPVGGEDRDPYRGSARLVRASGTEAFDITRDGAAAVEHPDPGEVIWCDDAGATCRRWNWRQGTRTRITETTTRAVFILDGLSELGPERVAAAADALQAALHALSPGIATQRRTIAGPAYQ